MKILMVQHSLNAPPGYLGERILARGGWFDVFQPADAYAAHAPTERTDLPPDDAGYDGLAILGGPMDAWDDAHFPHFRALFALLGTFERAGKPVLGLCLGAQLIARSHGAQVGRMARMELGLPPVTLLPAAEQDALLRGLPARQRLLEWHRDAFGLPDGAVLLATSDGCPNQIVRVGAATYACQGHPEATLDAARRWVFDSRHDLPPDQGHDLPGIVAHMERHWTEARPFADTLLDRWLDLVAGSKQG